MLPVPRFRGPLKYRLRSAEIVAHATATVTARRLRHGPFIPEWNWAVELGTEILRNQLHFAFSLPDAPAMRRYLDTLVLAPRVSTKLAIAEVDKHPVRGAWFTPSHPGSAILFYLHGGGFAFYPRASYAQFISLIAETLNLRTFALDYPLSPEHRFPHALHQACQAYLWLLDLGVPPDRILLAGDSAGGNLTLALLCHLRDRQLPLPALAFAFSPATEFDVIRPSMTANESTDWISGRMALTWRDWYCSPEQRSDPFVSPIHADLRNLPPIYIQAGRAEILYDGIAAFVAEAKRQGANVTFDAWPGMNHVFQFFGNDAPQSFEALRRVSRFVADTNLPA